MFNKLSILTTIFTVLATQCIAEPISIAEIKKQYEEASIIQRAKEDEEYFKYGYLGLKEPSSYKVEETQGEDGHSFISFQTSIKFLNSLNTNCKYKGRDTQCLKSTDFIDYSQALQLTKDFLKKVGAFNPNKLEITIFGETPKEAEDFLKYWIETDKVLSIGTTLYYKDSIGMDEEMENQLVYEIEEKYLKETREYMDKIASLIKEDSKRRILGKYDEIAFYYITEELQRTLKGY